MISAWNFRWLVLYFIVLQLNMHYVETDWPSSNFSNIQLLGLFQDPQNSTDTTELSVHSRAMFKAAVLLSQQYNITIQGQFIGWQSAQTGGNVINALGSTCAAVSSSNIFGIVGPALSSEAVVIAQFGKTLGIPVISYSATNPGLSDQNTYPAFHRTVPSDEDAILAIVKLFNRFNWTSCVIIYQNDQFGTGGRNALSDAFSKNNFTLSGSIVFDIATLSIQDNLKTSLINAATRIVIVWAEQSYTSLIVQTALDYNVVGPLFTWILSSSIPLDSFNQTFIQNLTGMLTIEPTIGSIVGVSINTTLLNAAYNLWQQYEPETFPGSDYVNNYALFAFDATWTLIRSLQQLCSTTKNSSSSCISFTSSSFCFNSWYNYADLLLNVVSATKFLGVSGLVQFSTNATDRIGGSYYYVQNVQPTSNGANFVPVLDYTDSGDWNPHSGANVIMWPGNTLIAPPDRAVLKGITLRIGIIASTPYTMVTNIIDSSGQTQTQYTGYIPDLIALLQKNMGFIPNVILAPSNQTYDKAVQAVADGIYDILVGDVTVTSARRQVVDFSNPIFNNALRIIMRSAANLGEDLLTFLKPFSFNLWLLILGTCVCSGILICLIERHNNEALAERSILSQVLMGIWYSFGSMVGGGADFEVKTLAGRLLTAGLYMLSLVLVASYTANLASNLTIQKSQISISGIDDVKAGKIPYSRIGIRVGTSIEAYYLEEISGGIQNFYPLYSNQAGYDYLLAGVIDAVFLDTGAAQYMTNNIYCNLTLVGSGFDGGSFAIAAPKNWIYLQDLDVNILSLAESGELDALQQKWFDKNSCPIAPDTSVTMSVQTVGGLFVTFVMVSAFSLLLMAWSKRCKMRQSSVTPVNPKKPSSKRENSTVTYSNQAFERAPNNQVASSDIAHW